jgi:hypothetical protein
MLALNEKCGWNWCYLLLFPLLGPVAAGCVAAVAAAQAPTCGLKQPHYGRGSVEDLRLREASFCDRASYSVVIWILVNALKVKIHQVLEARYLIR